MNTRAAEMKMLRRTGMTLQAIGDKYDISGERVRQIVNDIVRPVAIRSPMQKKCAACNRVSFTTRSWTQIYCRECSGRLATRQGREKTREKVRLRDNDTCRSCGKKWDGGRRFDVHHTDGLCGKKSRRYDRVDDIEKLITLCHKCHYAHNEFRQSSTRKVDVIMARKLREIGLTYDAIGRALEVSYTAVYKALN